jgi:Kef-type K+ transport system membrane component KefB
VELGNSPESLVLITVAAVLAPLAAEALRRWRIPSVLFELLLGMLIGPQLLGWAEVTPFIDAISELGLYFLMFLAGYEIDFARVRGAPLRLATIAWLCSLALGLGLTLPLVVSGFALSDLLVGLAVTTTAIGTLLPMLRDRGLLASPFGRFALAGGSLGEFGPILAITLLLSDDAPAKELVLLVAFVGIAGVIAAISTRPQPPAFLEVIHRHLTTSTQLPVRIIVALLTAMVFLAYELQLDVLLGAFTAGMVVRLAVPRSEAHAVEAKVEAIGFGFLVPIFFIVSGMSFDLKSLGDPGTLARVPLFLAMFLVVRGLPVLVLYRRELDGAARRSLALLQGTALPLVVVITGIGLESGDMKPENAAALVGAGMLSVLVFPLLGFAQLARSPMGQPVEGPSRDEEVGLADPGDDAL